VPAAGARWLVLNIDGRCAGVHDRYELCETCWSSHRRRVQDAQRLLMRTGTIVYTGGNGVHVWIALSTPADAFVFAHAGARALLRDRLGLPALDADAYVRVPGALHERTGRMSHMVSAGMPWPPT